MRNQNAPTSENGAASNTMAVFTADFVFMYGDEFHTFRERRLDFLQFLLDAVDDAERVLAVTRHDAAADDFAFAIEFGDASPDVGAKMNGADVLHIDRRALLRFKRDVLDVLDTLNVAAPPHVKLGGADLEDFSAHVAVGHADFVHDFADGDAVGGELVRIEVHLILLHEAADGRYFRNPFHGFERETQVPVLEGAQLGEVVLPRLVHERVFKDPAHAGRVRADYRVHAFG